MRRTKAFRAKNQGWSSDEGTLDEQEDPGSVVVVVPFS